MGLPPSPVLPECMHASCFLMPACTCEPLLHAYAADTRYRSAGAELASVISFLLQLGGQDMAQPLALDAMQPAEGEICAHLALLGLLLPFRRARCTPLQSPLAVAAGPNIVICATLTWLIQHTMYMTMA